MGPLRNTRTASEPVKSGHDAAGNEKDAPSSTVDGHHRDFNHLLPEAARDADLVPDRRLTWSTVRQLAPAAVLVTGLIVALATGWADYLTLATLADHRESMIAWVDRQGLMAGVIYAGLVVTVAALSIPAMAVMNVSAGFLFGPVIGTAVATVGQTIGGFIVFLAARHAFREALSRRAGPVVKRMEAGFRHNALSYMLTVRFMPMFPAWLVNLVPGLLGVPARTFILGTAIGVIPCTFVFATVGSGLGAVIDQGDTPSMAIFLELHILLPLLALVALALMPSVLKWWRHHTAEKLEENSDRARLDKNI
jgi:uncharacterized membrane protein YdjX (TVP38/TMEM64 family)